MIKAEPLYPTNLPQCEAMRENVYANDKPDTDKQCSKSARYRVGEHCFCTSHAGIAALSILMRKETP